MAYLLDEGAQAVHRESVSLEHRAPNGAGRNEGQVTARCYGPYYDTPKESQFLTRIQPSFDRATDWPGARWEYMIYSVQSGLENDLASLGPASRG